MKKFHILIAGILAVGGATIINSCATKAQNVPMRDSAFEYREIYLPEHDTNEYYELSLHDLNKEWGIWGHNIGIILPEKVSQNIYAKDGNKILKSQYCFTSNQLYEYIENYIVDNYGEENTARFAILPNDNAVVCTCIKCVAAGNTAKDASPAVMSMINRLAQRFPNHLFFTSYYSTTKGIPEEHMPANTGVLISAMDFPISAVETKQEHEFEKLIADWSAKTDHVYIWDYINNFDDYFTPYPVFAAMHRRLQLYKENGVQGIFFNGSGHDFSSFSRLKTHVLAEMLHDPNVDWKEILREKAIELYPTTGELIADFMIDQENFVIEKASELPLYEGIYNEIQTYLPEERFIKFHEDLAQALNSASSKEKKELEPIVKAMELTRLELMRKNSDIEGYEPHLANLRSLDTDGDVHVYSETCWTIPSYIKDFEFMVQESENKSKNKLLGVRLEPQNGLDPNYSDISILTDGLLAMPSNYHNGMMINTPDELWRIGIPVIPGMNKLRVWMVVNPAFRIGLPRRVVLQCNGRILGSIVPEKKGEGPGHTYVDFDIPSDIAGKMQLQLVRNPDAPAMALEEIEGF